MLRTVMMVIAALALPRLARADFEGVLESRITGPASGGDARTWISKVGIRNEVQLRHGEAGQDAAAGTGTHLVTIVKMAEPNVTYLLDEKRKTYSVVESKPEASGDDASGDERRWTVRRIGKGSVAGHACEQVAVTSPSGRESEVCVTEEFSGGDAWLRAFQGRESHQERGLFEALHDAGVNGLPIRWSSKGKNGGGAFTMELVSARKERVPASRFEIPAGYTKAEHGMSAADPETSKKIDEAMKNLTPEQRKRMDEIMKKLGK